MEYLLIGIATMLILGCSDRQKTPEDHSDPEPARDLSGIYTTFTLTTDISGLSNDERAAIPVLIEAAKIMDHLFWQESYGDRAALLRSIDDELLHRYARYNYGPWDRLNGDTPFIEGVGAKPLGAQFYPSDMTKDEFEAWEHPDKRSLYTFIERDGNGDLTAVWYHEKFAEDVNRAADLLDSAAL